MEEHIFPDRSELIHRGVQALAKRMGCSEALIDASIGSLDLAWSSPEHLNRVDETTHHFNRAARLARELARAMAMMTEGQKTDLAVAGAATSYQVEHLADVLAGDATSLATWSRDRFRRGGRNIAAYNVAELVRRVARRMRLKITYGADSFGAPSTEFGRMVQFALGEFGVKASWRGPTREAVDCQASYAARISSCAIRAAMRNAPNPND